MLKAIEVRGKTAEEAIANALQQLGLDRDDVQVEVLERGKTGFLGIGAVEAVVRVSYESNEPEEETAPVVEEKKEQPKVVREVKTKKTSNKEPGKTDNRATGVQAKPCEEFLRGLFDRMGVQPDMVITDRQGGGLDVELSGNGIGAIIGRRGETLDAVQHLTNYVVNRGNEHRGHINVDAEGYRAKRSDSLERLAKKMAEKAIKYKRSMALEPMNSYERHIIHTTLQDYEGVTTSSPGSEPNRRVVVHYAVVEKVKEEPEVKEWF